MRCSMLFVLVVAGFAQFTENVFAAPFVFDGGTNQGWTSELTAFDSDTGAILTLQSQSGATWWDVTNYPGFNGSDPSGDLKGSIVRPVGGDLGEVSAYEFVVVTYLSPNLSGMADWQGIDAFSGRIHAAGAANPLAGPSYAQAIYEVFDHDEGRTRRFAKGVATAPANALTPDVWNKRQFDGVLTTLASASPAVTNYTTTHVGFNVWIPLNPLPSELVAMYVDHVISVSGSTGAAITWVGGNGEWRDGPANNVNWSPADEPDFDDIAIFNASNNVLLGTANQVAGLQLSNGAKLNLNSHQLYVDGNFELTGIGTEVMVPSGSQLHAMGGSIDGSSTPGVSRLRLSGGEIRLAGPMEVGNPGLPGQNPYRSIIAGEGTIVLTGPQTPGTDGGNISNQGAIGPALGTITIDASNTIIGGVDLDGNTGNGVLDVHDGDHPEPAVLRVLAPLSDPEFNGTIFLGNNDALEISDDWELGSTALLRTIGGPEPGVIRGGRVAQRSGSTIDVASGAYLRFDAPYVMTGGEIINDGTITFHSYAAFGAAATASGPGALANTAVSTLVLEDSVALDTHIVNSGLLQLGEQTPIAQVQLNRFTQGAGGTLVLDLMGVGASEFDKLQTSGFVEVSGALVVSLTGGFTPLLGDTFEILTASGVEGTFSAAVLPYLGQFLKMDVHYGANSVTLAVVPSLDKDYNGDGTVDAADYVVWRHSLGDVGVGLPADGNGDHMITELDYDLWLANFGATSGSGANASASVPEPATTIMLLVGMATMISGGRTPVKKLVKSWLSTSFLASCVVAGFSVNTHAGGIAPSFVTQPQDQEVVVGSDVSFFVDVIGDEPISYQWRKDSEDITGATDSSYSILHVALLDAGSFDVRATNPFGESISDPALLTVVDGIAPSFITQPQSQKIVVGSEVSFFVDVMGDEPISYQWRKDGEDIVGATDSSYSILHAALLDAGSFDVRATNPFGESISDPALLSVVPEPAISTLLGTAIVGLFACGTKKGGRRRGTGSLSSGEQRSRQPQRANLYRLRPRIDY